MLVSARILSASPFVRRSFPVQPLRARTRRLLRVQSFFDANELVATTGTIGKGVILFVGFYTGLQWLYYRDLRERAEAAAKEREEASKPKPTKPKTLPPSGERPADF